MKIMTIEEFIEKLQEKMDSEIAWLGGERNKQPRVIGVKDAFSLINKWSEELSKFNKPTVIGCLHPFNDVVSGNDGDFCCKCQSYLKSNRL